MAPIMVGAFTDGLREYGYVEGTNLKIEFRWAQGHSERWSELVRELIEADVQLIVTTQTPAAVTLKERATTLPVVIVGVSHPVEAGLVQTLARPGGNITGVSNLLGDLDAKLLQLCREVFPKMSRIAILWNPANQGSALGLKTMQSLASKEHIAVLPVSARTPDEVEGVVATLTRQRPDVLLVHGAYALAPELVQIRQFASRSRIPTISPFSSMTQDGLLMSYGPDLASNYRRGAYYVHRILMGTKPADLPVEQPTKFELVINLKTAKALGLTLSPSLLARADQVIE